MGWVTRPNGRRYLYRSRRVGGRVVTEYLAADGTAGGKLLALEWEAYRLRRVRSRLAQQRADARLGKRLARLERLAADDTLRVVAHGLLTALGFHRPKRGVWRMRRGYNPLAALLAPNPGPQLNYTAPADDTEAVALFAAARAGDKDAVDKLPALIRDRGWVRWIGDLARQATFQLIDRVARGDPVLRAGLDAKVAALWAELAGPAPTVLEEVLVRRVVNGWVLTHAVELELALTDDPRAQVRLDKLLGRSQRRLAEAVRELARVRRLQAPALLAKLQAGRTALPAESAPVSD
ncbi:MAG: hypothetical protein U0871_01880 [Gemmataceae bacterium]